ncbi:MAG TPA: hypothetical protein VFU89_00140 [Rhabdochlamydiaceae bacterium]|nr:hypothetical protein [Rhabdochlamydiaceae bacterium]
MVTPSSYYSRNWENIALLPSLEKDQWIKYGKLTAELVLPFISLCKPAQLPISYAFGLWNITQASYSFLQAPHKYQDAAEIAKNVAELAFTYFELRAGLIVNTTLELLQYFYLPEEKRVERLGSFISTSLYLLSLLKPFSPQWTVVSLIFHACLSLYQAYQAGKEAHQAGTYLHEKTPVAIAKGLMGITRFYQAYQSYVILKNIQALEFLLKRNQEMAEETDLLIEKNADPAETQEVINDPSHSTQEQSSQDTPELQQIPTEEVPLEDGLTQIQRNDGSSVEALEEAISFNDHPLKNLVQKIEAKRVVLINPTTGEKQDFGAYFYGYGKQLVKGANLRFQYAVTEKGSHVTELHFRISEQYKERVLKHLEALHKSSPEQARQFAASLKGKKLSVEMKHVWEKKDYSPKPSALHVKGVGSLFLNPDKMSDFVKVSLK